MKNPSWLKLIALGSSINDNQYKGRGMFSKIGYSLSKTIFNIGGKLEIRGEGVKNDHPKIGYHIWMYPSQVFLHLSSPRDKEGQTSLFIEKLL